MTTASAPSGTKPPVAMATACPGPTRPLNTAPIGTAPMTSKEVAASGLAPARSAARTA